MTENLPGSEPSWPYKINTLLTTSRPMLYIQAFNWLSRQTNLPDCHSNWAWLRDLVKPSRDCHVSFLLKDINSCYIWWYWSGACVIYVFGQPNTRWNSIQLNIFYMNLPQRIIVVRRETRLLCLLPILFIYGNRIPCIYICSVNLSSQYWQNFPQLLAGAINNFKLRPFCNFHFLK